MYWKKALGGEKLSFFMNLILKICTIMEGKLGALTASWGGPCSELIVIFEKDWKT